MKTIFCLLGPPCIGKNTQCNLLKYKIPVFSLGNLLRDKFPAHTEIGKKLRNGINISSSIVNNIMLEKINEYNKIIFDGVPRSVDQVEFLNQWNYYTIILTGKDEDLIERMKKRFFCNHCQNTFDHKQICCDQYNIKRSDDNIITFQKRLETYNSTLQEIISKIKNIYYINGDRPILDVHKDIENIINKILI